MNHYIIKKNWIRLKKQTNRKKTKFNWRIFLLFLLFIIETLTSLKAQDYYVQESNHIKLEIDPNLLSISSNQVDAWLSNLDRMYDQYVDLMSGFVPYQGNKITIQSVSGINAWAYSGNPVQWNSNYVSSTLTSFVTNGDWSFGIMHELGHDFNGNFSGFGTGNTSYDWNEEIFANFRMYLAMTKVTDATVDMRGIRHGAEIADYYKFDYDCKTGNNEPLTSDALMWTLIRIGDHYQKNGDHGYWLFKQAFEIINTTPRNETEEQSWTDWQKFNYFLDILSSCAGVDVRETYSTEELKLVQFALDRNNFYDGTLQTPTNRWQTVSDKIQSNGYFVYRVFVTQGQKYSFKICCEDGASADFNAKLSLYNNQAGDRLYPDLWNGDICASGTGITDIENYQFNYTGYAYIKVQGNSASDYGNYTLAYQTTNLITPANDQCANATFLSCGTPIQGTLAGATPTTSVSYRDDFDKNDVFYNFTATDTGDYTIIFVKSNASDEINLGLYSSCDITTPLINTSGNNAIETITYSCIAGTTYLIRASSYTGGAFTIWLSCQGGITDDGVIIGGVKWATRNVGTPGTFAVNLESAGWLYQWNRNIGWSAIDPLINSNFSLSYDNSVPQSENWIAENDPCPCGWRVPTLSEIFSLWGHGEWATINGVNGRKFTDTNTGNSIFLPFAGHRDINGTLNDTNRGWYWTSNMSDDNPAFLIITDDNDFGEGWAVWYDGRYGQSVRCVAKDLGTNISDIESSSFKIYPNPVKDVIFIESVLPINKLEIYSLTGSLLLSNSNVNRQISVSSLSKGIYLVKVYTDNGVAVSKIVKE